MEISARKPKTVIIPTWYPSKTAPIEGIFVREQARQLARLFDVTVLTPRFPSLLNLFCWRWGPELIEEDDLGVHTWRVRKLKVPTLRRFLPILDPDHVFVYYRKFASAIRRGFQRYVRERGLPVVIHAHVVLPAGGIAVELGREFGVPVVLTEHSGPFAQHLSTERQRQAVRTVLHSADRVVAVSDALRAHMNAFCPEVRIDVIGNVIDTDFLTPAPAMTAGRAKRTFFFLGGLVPEKGVQYLLEAARILLTRGSVDFDIRLAGAGGYRLTLEQLVDKYQLRDHCRFLGMLDRARVRDEMRACDVFVLPSLGETFGIVAAEAMACGKPVLSTRCGGPEEVVTPDTGVLVAPGNAAELADAMAGFLIGRHSFNPQSIRDSVVRRFGKEAFLAQVGSLYTDLPLPALC